MSCERDRRVPLRLRPLRPTDGLPGRLSPLPAVGKWRGVRVRGSHRVTRPGLVLHGSNVYPFTSRSENICLYGVDVGYPEKGGKEYGPRFLSRVVVFFVSPKLLLESLQELLVSSVRLDFPDRVGQTGLHPFPPTVTLVTDTTWVPRSLSPRGGY